MAEASEEIPLIRKLPEERQIPENSRGSTTESIQSEPFYNKDKSLYTIHTRSRGKAMDSMHVNDRPIEYKARCPKKKK